MSNTSPHRTPGPSWYEIRVHGRLDPRWSTRFEGMTLTTTDGDSLLAGFVVDQAALHGLLHQLRDTGLRLISITPATDEAGTTHPPRTTDTGA